MPDYASSVQAVSLRLSKLAADGSPLPGATNSYVTRAFTSLSFTPEYQDGDEISVTAADGSVCVYYKVPDTLKRVNFEIAICNPQPEIYEMLAGGTILTELTENIGWSAPEIGSAPGTDGVSIEAWSRAIVGGRPAAVRPYFRFVFPYVQTRLSGDRVLENGALANVFSGFGLGNDGWGEGPAVDWTFPSTSALSFARAATAPTTEGFAVVV